MSDLITISSSVIPRSARVVGFRGTEAISRPYEIEIFLAVPQELGEEFDLADAIGAKAKLIIDRQKLGVATHTFAGIFASVEVMHAFEGRLLLRALLVPRLWQLGLSRHSRVFTKMKVPDIISTVLEENGVTDFELRLGAFEPEEHVCQYRESDLDFISRWMEREGIFYFFEHTDDGEKLILCDKRLYDDDEGNGPVRYYPQLGHDHSSGPAFRSFRCRHSTLPANVRLKDYDYAKPNLPVSGASKVAQNGAGEVSLYGERFFTPAAGEKLAKVRAEEMLARQVVFHATGNRLHIRPGYTFELEEHPFPSFNAKYLTIEAIHSSNQSAGLSHFRELTGIDHEDVYQVELHAIPASTQFRAESKTIWPRIYGFENGVVDGPADSDYAQIDDQGRYLCKFKFDESKLKNGKATTYVRMMQPHGGDIEGFHFPLRKGTEVVFSFMGGDCDRPVITGVVPNALNPSPVTAANYTKNVIQTGGRNRLEIEDKAGSEWIKLSTPYADTYLRMGSPSSGHEMILNTEKNTLFEYGNNWDVNVGKKGGGNWVTEVKDGFATLHIPDGNWRIGVLDGIGINAQNGISILINGGAAVPGEGGEGGFKMTIQDHGMEVTAKEEIKMQSTTQSIKLEAQEKVEIIAHADQLITTDGKTWELKKEESNEIIMADTHEIRLADAHEFTLANKHEITIGNSEGITIGNSTEMTVGNKTETIIGDTTETHNGNTTETHHGNSDETTVGITNENFFGLKNSFEIAGSLEVTVGVKLAFELALALEMAASIAIAFKGIEVNFTTASMEEKAAALGNKLLHLKVGGVNLETLGFKLVA
jgi:type VI secretion system secreted protein VgrG